jgi:dipeptidyl-peptidase-4
MPSRRDLLILCLASVSCFVFIANDYAEEAAADSSLLTLDRIFSSPEFKGEDGPAIQWMKKRGGYTTLEAAKNESQRDLVWNDPASGKKEVLVPSHRFIPSGEDSPLSIESYWFSDDESKLLIFTEGKRVWRLKTRGDFWVLDITAGELKKLGGTAAPSTLMFATFSPDGSRVAFVKDNNLYVQDLRDMSIVALTSDGSSTVINGTFDWVNEEELNLYRGYRWSPDSKRIAYWQVNIEGVREYHLVNSSDQLYSQIQAIPYPKVGERNSAVRIGVVNAAGGATMWLEIPGDPREHYLAQMDWVGPKAPTEIVLQQFNRLQNTNRLMTTDVSRGLMDTLLTETDAAWVENSNAKLRWYNDEQNLIWLSERDGWQHAYSVSRSDGKTTLLTPGKFDVLNIDGIEPSGECLYFSASPDEPTRRALFRTKNDRGKVERVSPANQLGTHTYDISPDAKWAIHTYSTFDAPPVVDLVSLPDHRSVRTFVENKELKELLAKLKSPSTQFFRINLAETVALDAWEIKPPDFDASKSYPVLFYVYGEPAGQTVLDRWQGKRHLWHLMLAQQGYVVISIDNRGTPAPRGREWRKSVYRQIGILASADQANATRALLKERPYLDPKRVAIWGWSGGGSMTLNALFRYPDLYRTGMSIAPVPNQRLYDTIYQERYMGLPGDNPVGYRMGSPITFANQLEGNLMLIHGTGDDNCHYQGTEALINELIAHNKQFSMLAYPNRSHGISERKNTTRHLFSLLTRFLNEKSPPNP